MTRSSDLLGRLLGPAEPELTCDACFDELDRYVDLETGAGSAQADAAIPGMRAHLRGCPACREEHDGLVALAERSGSGPATLPGTEGK